MTKQELWLRLKNYVSRTGLRVSSIPRLEGWTALGLPDTRGFTPHLRRVNIYKRQSFEEESWLMHDLLHILFYDFASLHLGHELWLERERFLENHLASEAFAVLALDYHILAFSPQEETLTVDVNSKVWQKLSPDLPDLRSEEFTIWHVQHYLTGQTQDWESKSKKSAFKNWIGHEIRYAKKQRAYVQMWFEDLMNLRPRNETIELNESAAHEAVWELLRLLLNSDEQTWDRYVAQIKKSVKDVSNYFEKFPKYQANLPKYDFRFTDLASLQNRNVKKVERSLASRPNASDLFLVWQALSLFDPGQLTSSQKKLVADVARGSHTNNIKTETWKSLIQLTSSLLKVSSWDAETELRASFFLP